MIARLPLNARSECVAPSTLPVGGVVESMRMFHAAWPASQRPGLSPTRGSGDGVVAETIGSTGFGITAGGGGGGGGGFPRPAGAGGAIVSGAADGAAGAAGAAGAGAAGAADGGGAVGGGAAAGGGALGVAAGGDEVVFELAQAYTPTANAASTMSFFISGDLPASRASWRSRCLDRHRHRSRT